jgi:hypothetical protein
MKRIIIYVNGFVNHGVWYIRETNLNLAGYSDADWVGNVVLSKKHFRCLFLCGHKYSGVDEQEAKFNLSTHG